MTARGLGVHVQVLDALKVCDEERAQAVEDENCDPNAGEASEIKSIHGC